MRRARIVRKLRASRQPVAMITYEGTLTEAERDALIAAWKRHREDPPRVLGYSKL